MASRLVPWRDRPRGIPPWEAFYARSRGAGVGAAPSGGALLGIPGVTGTDSRTVSARGPLPGLYRQFGVWMRVAASMTNQPPYC
ncbi:D-aminopeptidase [Streptomyces laurentii]|uniref:D-aminopeptidase n=1 Tax=Streptomyces laurentii TaxID=39478 RepID=A0A160P953_STRLU|nr:D-aminopeptidase [Streptomyces laurentii]